MMADMGTTVAPPITITAEKKGPPRVSLVAYTGGALILAGHVYPVVLDVNGLIKERRTVPLLRDHDASRPVGHVTETRVVAGEVVAAGLLSHAGEERDKVVTAAAEEYPWQVSIGAEAAVDESGKRMAGAVEFVSGGQTVNINGRVMSGPLSVYRKWFLVEISILALGADGNTSLSVAAANRKSENRMTIEALLERAGIGPDLAPEIQAAIRQEANIEAEKRIAHHNELRKICAGFPALLDKAIANGWTAEQTELAVLKSDALKSKHNAPIGNPPITPVEAGGEVDGLLARYGYGKGDKPMRSAVRLTDIIRANMADHSMVIPDNVDELVRAGLQMPNVRAEISSTSLPTVLEGFTRRVLEDSYRETPQSFWAFTKKVYVPDFRPQKGVRLHALNNLEPLADGGEIKHDKITEDVFYQIEVDTFAKLLRLTREDIINDDLGAFTDMAAAMSRAAARTLSDLVYRTLLEAPSGYFSADHNNILTGTDSVLNVDSLATAIGKLRTMRDDKGNDLDIRPHVLLVPPELEFIARQLLDSVSVQWLGKSEDIVSRPSGNSLKDTLKIAVEPRLSNPKFSGASDRGWYLFADATTAAMAVAFLPGKDMPTVETFGLEQSVNTLAYSWRIFHDFGATLGDWRGVVKGTGE